MANNKDDANKGGVNFNVAFDGEGAKVENVGQQIDHSGQDRSTGKTVQETDNSTHVAGDAGDITNNQTTTQTVTHNWGGVVEQPAPTFDNVREHPDIVDSDNAEETVEAINLLESYAIEESDAMAAAEESGQEIPPPDPEKADKLDKAWGLIKAHGPTVGKVALQAAAALLPGVGALGAAGKAVGLVAGLVARNLDKPSYGSYYPRPSGYRAGGSLGSPDYD